MLMIFVTFVLSTTKVTCKQEECAVASYPVSQFALSFSNVTVGSLLKPLLQPCCPSANQYCPLILALQGGIILSDGLKGFVDWPVVRTRCLVESRDGAFACFGSMICERFGKIQYMQNDFIKRLPVSTEGRRRMGRYLLTLADTPPFPQPPDSTYLHL